jgi:hypothetical protein
MANGQSNPSWFENLLRPIQDIFSSLPSTASAQTLEDTPPIQGPEAPPGGRRAILYERRYDAVLDQQVPTGRTLIVSVAQGGLPSSQEKAELFAHVYGDPGERFGKTDLPVAGGVIGGIGGGIAGGPPGAVAGATGGGAAGSAVQQMLTSPEVGRFTIVGIPQTTLGGTTSGIFPEIGTGAEGEAIRGFDPTNPLHRFGLMPAVSGAEEAALEFGGGQAMRAAAPLARGAMRLGMRPSPQLLSESGESVIPSALQFGGIGPQASRSGRRWVTETERTFQENPGFWRRLWGTPSTTGEPVEGSFARQPSGVRERPYRRPGETPFLGTLGSRVEGGARATPTTTGVSSWWKKLLTSSPEGRPSLYTMVKQSARNADNLLAPHKDLPLFGGQGDDILSFSKKLHLSEKHVPKNFNLEQWMRQEEALGTGGRVGVKPITVRDEPTRWVRQWINKQGKEEVDQRLNNILFRYLDPEKLSADMPGWTIGRARADKAYLEAALDDVYKSLKASGNKTTNAMHVMMLTLRDGIDESITAALQREGHGEVAQQLYNTNRQTNMYGNLIKLINMSPDELATGVGVGFAAGSATAGGMGGYSLFDSDPAGALGGAVLGGGLAAIFTSPPAAAWAARRLWSAKNLPIPQTSVRGVRMGASVGAEPATPEAMTSFLDNSDFQGLRHWQDDYGREQRRLAQSRLENYGGPWEAMPIEDLIAMHGSITGQPTETGVNPLVRSALSGDITGLDFGSLYVSPLGELQPSLGPTKIGAAPTGMQPGSDLMRALSRLR